MYNNSNKRRALLKKIPKSKIARSIEMKKLIQSFNLTSDFFLSVVLEDIPACEYVLRILMGKKDLKVKTVKTQYSIRQIGTHSVYLDVLAEDSEGKVYEIEMQNGNHDNHVRRVRYITGSIDTAFLDKGMDYQGLPELHIFYITAFDLAGLGKTVYDVIRKVKGTDVELDNGVHEHYINTVIDDETDIANLMKYFVKTEASDTSRGALSERVGYLKGERKGDDYMCDVLKEYVKDHINDFMDEETIKRIEEEKAINAQRAEAIGKAIGKADALAIAKMYYKGKTAVEISITLNMPEEEVADAIRQLEE